MIKWFFKRMLDHSPAIDRFFSANNAGKTKYTQFKTVKLNP